jgi:hypothetical protein
MFDVVHGPAQIFQGMRFNHARALVLVSQGSYEAARLNRHVKSKTTG